MLQEIINYDKFRLIWTIDKAYKAYAGLWGPGASKPTSAWYASGIAGLISQQQGECGSHFGKFCFREELDFKKRL